MRAPILRRVLVTGLARALLALTALPAYGQVPASDEFPITVGDSNVGYIDSAIPGSEFRLRYDDSFNNNRPNRAEFFWPKGSAAGGPGTPIAERSVDYQDISAYLELAVDRCTSLFVEVPVRFLNPELNDNTAGLGDMNAGVKRALWFTDDCVLSFQFRTYIPTGDADRGLGNDHVSLEPALLLYKRLSDCWSIEAELRDWIPVNGTDFAGNVIRYGIGAAYHGLSLCDHEITPVVEFVGWTVLDGKVTIVDPPAPTRVEDAEGDTIVNVKVGVRMGVGCNGQIYTGYGRSLTGDRWYSDTWRLEYRLFF